MRRIAPYMFWDQQGLALLRAATLARQWFVGPLGFYFIHRLGKPVDKNPGGEPYGVWVGMKFIL